MSDIDSLLLSLSDAPDTQIDSEITPKIAGLIGKPLDEIAVGMKAILDECAFASLASDFAMVAMDSAWRIAKGDSQ